VAKELAEFEAAAPKAAASKADPDADPDPDPEPWGAPMPKPKPEPEPDLSSGGRSTSGLRRDAISVDSPSSSRIVGHKSVVKTEAAKWT